MVARPSSMLSSFLGWRSTESTFPALPREEAKEEFEDGPFQPCDPDSEGETEDDVGSVTSDDSADSGDAEDNPSTMRTRRHQEIRQLELSENAILRPTLSCLSSKKSSAATNRMLYPAGKQSMFDSYNQDDEEELPQNGGNSSGIKERFPTPLIKSEHATPQSSCQSTTLATATNTVSAHLADHGTIDSTILEDTHATPIKQETADTDYPTPVSGARRKTADVNEEDEEDLEDELREIQIRRKLRALKKRKLADGSARR